MKAPIGYDFPYVTYHWYVPVGSVAMTVTVYWSIFVTPAISLSVETSNSAPLATLIWPVARSITKLSQRRRLACRSVRHWHLPSSAVTGSPTS